jgi:HD superfamily phosphohydrolase
MSSPASSKSRPPEATSALKAKINQWVKEILQGYEPRHIRDNKVIRDAVFGFNRFYQHEINLIDSPLLQRLRCIHQTALALFAYPTATHSRFEHSLGCVVVADRMIRAINEKKKTPPIENKQRADVRLAALLHDCGHGPFSHVSEFVYDTLSPELQDVRFENMDKFGHAAGHEILTYLIVTSEKFGELWRRICGLYDPTSESLLCQLKDIDLERVGSMILGLPAPGCPGYLAEIINGPFDADKFDYIIRDGYFSGLITAIDIERLAVSLDLHQEGMSEPVLCMDIGGATILEQLLFNKMVLFSSMYHHHKVRSSFRQLARLLQTARDKGIAFSGVKLSSAANFLELDDYKVLSYAMQEPILRNLAEDIHNRRLPKRALVIDRGTLKNTASRQEWVEIGANLGEIFDLEAEIASKAKISREDVCIDFPPEPRVYKTAQASMVRLAPGRPLVSLDDLYPVAGWMAGYEQYRFRSYIFSTNGSQEKVANAAKRALEKRRISLDFDLSKRLAKWQ